MRKSSIIIDFLPFWSLKTVKRLNIGIFVAHQSLRVRFFHASDRYMQDSLLRETCVACARTSFVYKYYCARTCGNARRVRTALKHDVNDLTQFFF